MDGILCLSMHGLGPKPCCDLLAAYGDIELVFEG